MDGEVEVLAAYDDGGGPALYAGGEFSAAGGVLASNVARWDGSSWSALGDGTDEKVRALVAYSTGGESVLLVAGHFTSAGGVETPGLARWQAPEWSSLGRGLRACEEIPPTTL